MFGAARGIRTPDPVITNDVLYRLSYCGGPCGASGFAGDVAPVISGGERLCKKCAQSLWERANSGAKHRALAAKRLQPPHRDRKPRQPPAWLRAGSVGSANSSEGASPSMPGSSGGRTIGAIGGTVGAAPES